MARSTQPAPPLLVTFPVGIDTFMGAGIMPISRAAVAEQFSKKIGAGNLIFNSLRVLMYHPKSATARKFQMRSSFLLCGFFVVTSAASADSNVRVEVNKAGGVSIFRPDVKQPLFAFVAPEDGRPYVHPLLAPDGKGVLTEF